MTGKPRSCSPDHTLLDAIHLMRELDVGYVPVCGQGERLLGVVTDRDIALALAQDEVPSAVSISRVMSRDPVSCRPGDDLFDCERLMEEHQIRRMPVVDEDNRLVGVISMADLARRARGQPEIESEIPSLIESISQPS
jgi:CBS domain-containing protein